MCDSAPRRLSSRGDDADDDGYAESGNGTLYSIVTLSVAASRLALPGG